MDKILNGVCEKANKQELLKYHHSNENSKLYISCMAIGYLIYIFKIR